MRTLGLGLNSVSDSQTTGVAAVTGIQTSSVNVVPAIQTTTVNSVPAITTTGQTSQGGMSVAHMSGTVVSNTNLVAAQIMSPIMSTKVSGASLPHQFSIPALDIAHIQDQNQHKSAFTSVALPLHATVNQKVKEKIWANEYVELSTVFNYDIRLTSQISLNFSDSGASLNTTSRRRYITIEQWTDLFAKYASVMRIKYPESAEAMAKYSDTVCFIAKSNGQWHLYDTEFRKLRQSMSLPWDMIQHELYFKCLIQKTPFRRRQENRKASDANTSKKFCFKFNRGEHCSGCAYQHPCSFCGGTNHALFKCFKSGSGKGGSGQRGQQSDYNTRGPLVLRTLT